MVHMHVWMQHGVTVCSLIWIMPRVPVETDRKVGFFAFRLEVGLNGYKSGIEGSISSLYAHAI